MTRTINDIQQSILDRMALSSELSALEVLTENEKASLSNLTSTSKVSVWRLFIWIISYAIFVVEAFMDVFRKEITDIVQANKPHNEYWYKQKALAFQYGDTLVDTDEYAIIDETKKIIKQVAIIEGDRELTIKIATLSGDELVKIDDVDKVNAFKSYMHQVKDAGTHLEFVNENADKLKVDLDFYYNPLLLKSDGTMINNPDINVVQTAIVDYLKSLDFNGTFQVNRMVDYLQSATGYTDLKLNFVGFKAGIATSFTSINRVYAPLSGYMKLDELTVNYYASI
jgi:hypothetical protein